MELLKGLARTGKLTELTENGKARADEYRAKQQAEKAKK